jgi:hypothetical protein
LSWLGWLGLGFALGALTSPLLVHELRLWRRARYGGPVDLTGVKPRAPNVRRRRDDSRDGSP